MDEQLPENIVCAACGAAFTDVISPTQAGKCAAAVYYHEHAWYICGHYGSEFDGDLFRFRQAPPERFWGEHKEPGIEVANPEYGADPICDACVYALLHADALDQVPGDYPWGPPWLEGAPRGLVLESTETPEEVA